MCFLPVQLHGVPVFLPVQSGSLCFVIGSVRIVFFLAVQTVSLWDFLQVQFRIPVFLIIGSVGIPVGFFLPVQSNSFNQGFSVFVTGGVGIPAVFFFTGGVGIPLLLYCTHSLDLILVFLVITVRVWGRVFEFRKKFV